MIKKKVYIYQGFERFWHWMQALLIIFLAFTGFEVHGTYTFFGYKFAVQYHNLAAWLLMFLIIFAIFFHKLSQDSRCYIFEACRWPLIE